MLLSYKLINNSLNFEMSNIYLSYSLKSIYTFSLDSTSNLSISVINSSYLIANIFLI